MNGVEYGVKDLLRQANKAGQWTGQIRQGLLPLPEQEDALYETLPLLR